MKKLKKFDKPRVCMSMPGCPDFFQQRATTRQAKTSLASLEGSPTTLLERGHSERVLVGQKGMWNLPRRSRLASLIHSMHGVEPRRRYGSQEIFKESPMLIEGTRSALEAYSYKDQAMSLKRSVIQARSNVLLE